MAPATTILSCLFPVALSRFGLLAFIIFGPCPKTRMPEQRIDTYMVLAMVIAIQILTYITFFIMHFFIAVHLEFELSIVTVLCLAISNIIFEAPQFLNTFGPVAAIIFVPCMFTSIMPEHVVGFFLYVSLMGLSTQYLILCITLVRESPYRYFPYVTVLLLAQGLAVASAFFSGMKSAYQYIPAVKRYFTKIPHPLTSQALTGVYTPFTYYELIELVKRGRKLQRRKSRYDNWIRECIHEYCRTVYRTYGSFDNSAWREERVLEGLDEEQKLILWMVSRTTNKLYRFLHGELLESEQRHIRHKLARERILPQHWGSVADKMDFLLGLRNSWEEDAV